MRRTFTLTAVATSLLCMMSLNAQADTLSDIFTQGHVDGEVRAYNFNRNYDAATTPNSQAFSAALLLNAQTGTFGGGFSLGASFATANSFGTQSSTVSHVDTTLMGPTNSLNALTQAYLQYKNDIFLFRGGYQYLNTPWMGGNDSRVIPSSYNSVLVGVTPTENWNLYAIRTFEWKSRTSSEFYSDNLYYPAAFNGDKMYGSSGALPSTASSYNGTWAVGSTYSQGGLKAQGWYYDFLQFARMGYAEGSYLFKNNTGINPVVGFQYYSQNGGGNNILVENGAKIGGSSGDRVRSNGWGANLGVVIPHGRLDAYYNKLDQKYGAIGEGALISPYTSTYATDPLYTTSMLRGLVEIGPGSAWKGKATYNFFQDSLQLVAAYATYDSVLRGKSHNTYFDIIYKFDGYLKGLQLRNRWERSTGGRNNLNPGNKPFIYNRLMLSYKF